MDINERNIIYLVCCTLLLILTANYFLNVDNNNGYCSNLYYDKSVECKFNSVKILCECDNISFDPTKISSDTNVFFPVSIV